MVKIKGIEQHVESFGNYILSDVLRSILVLGGVGLSIAYLHNLSMSSDVWFWFFSSIAQTFAALVALVAIFIISRIEFYDARINDITQKKREFPPEPRIFNVGGKTFFATQESLSEYQSHKEEFMKNVNSEIEKLDAKKKIAKDQMWKLLEHTTIIIMVSVLLLPLGSLSMGTNQFIDARIIDIWINYKLKWFVIFGIAGLCLSTLSKVESLLKNILGEKE